MRKKCKKPNKFTNLHKNFSYIVMFIYIYMNKKIKNIVILMFTVGAFFASRPRARPVGALGIFACPTLERLTIGSSLIR